MLYTRNQRNILHTTRSPLCLSASSFPLARSSPRFQETPLTSAQQTPYPPLASPRVNHRNSPHTSRLALHPPQASECCEALDGRAVLQYPQISPPSSPMPAPTSHFPQLTHHKFVHPEVEDEYSQQPPPPPQPPPQNSSVNSFKPPNSATAS